MTGCIGRRGPRTKKPDTRPWWECAFCHHRKQAKEPGDCNNCCDCGSWSIVRDPNIPPEPANIRYCNRCGHGYYAHLGRCDICGVQEFSHNPNEQTRAKAWERLPSPDVSERRSDPMIKLTAPACTPATDAADNQDEMRGVSSRFSSEYPIKTITLELPATCQTAVELLLVHIPESDHAPELWYGGCRVSRAFDVPGNYPTFHEELDLDDTDNGWATLGEAALAAATSARGWIYYHSGDDEEDPKSDEAGTSLQAWLDEFDPETATEAIFDTEEPAGSDSKPEATTEPVAETPAATIVDQAPPPKSSRVVVSEEAQQAFEDRRHALESIVANLAIEQMALKAKIKANRQALAEYTEDLEKHLNRGPERLPLFDRAPTPPETSEAKPAAEETPTAVAEAAAEAEAAIDAWRALKLADLDGLTPKIVEILDGHDIRTLGDWVDVPKLRGVEYTQLKGVTEARFEKIQAAMMKATTSAE